MKPAATCVSNSFVGAQPHARSRIARSCSAACATMQPGPARISARGAGSTSTDRSARCLRATRPAPARDAASRCARRGTRCRARTAARRPGCWTSSASVAWSIDPEEFHPKLASRAARPPLSGRPAAGWFPGRSAELGPHGRELFERPQDRVLVVGEVTHDHVGAARRAPGRRTRRRRGSVRRRPPRTGRSRGNPGRRSDQRPRPPPRRCADVHVAPHRDAGRRPGRDAHRRRGSSARASRPRSGSLRGRSGTRRRAGPRGRSRRRPRRSTPRAVRGGTGAMRARSISQGPSTVVTASPRHSARTMSSVASKRVARLAHRGAEDAELLVAAADRALHDERARAIAASVPICSASSTGCHSGSRNSAPAGRSSHSASRRPSIGTFW